MQDIGTNEILQAISNLGINLNKRIDNIEKIVRNEYGSENAAQTVYKN